MIARTRNTGSMHGPRRARAFLAAVLLAAGCAFAEEATQQPTSPPQVLEAENALEALPTPEAATASEEAAPAPDNPADAPILLDLETAQRRALDANPSLSAVEEQVAQAREYVRQARSAYFPQISASYRASRTRPEGDASQDLLGSEDDGQQTHRSHRVHESQTSIANDLGSASDVLGIDTGNVAEIQHAITGVQGSLDNLFGLGGLEGYSASEDTENYTFGVTAGLLLFDGFSRRMTHAMARFGREETEAAYQEARRMLLDAVALSYFGVQLARENMEVARADKEFNARLVSEVTIRCDLGKASVRDILNFEVRQLAAEAALESAEEDYASARVALALVMGEPDVRLPDNVEVAPLPVEQDEHMLLPNEDAAIEYALCCRPDLLQREYSVERAKAALRDRYGNLSPRVSLFASWNDQRVERGLYEQKNQATTVGVDVSYDIFTGGRKVSRIAEAKHAKRQAEYKRIETERNVIADVRQALIALKAAQKQLMRQRAASERVRMNRDLVELEFQAGKAPLVRLNQGQRDLVEAQARLAFARVNLLKAWHEFETATAETLEKFSDEE